MTDNCPDCGKEFERVASHIAQTDCEYPENNDKNTVVAGAEPASGASDEPEDGSVVESEEAVVEAETVPAYARSEESYGYDPSQMTRSQLEAQIEEYNEARRAGEDVDADEYDALHARLRELKEQ